MSPSWTLPTNEFLMLVILFFICEFPFSCYCNLSGFQNLLCCFCLMFSIPIFISLSILDHYFIFCNQLLVLIVRVYCLLFMFAVAHDTLIPHVLCKFVCGIISVGLFPLGILWGQDQNFNSLERIYSFHFASVRQPGVLLT